MLPSANLVGADANMILFTMEIVALVKYCTTSSSRDSFKLQAMVYVMFIADTVSTICGCASVYLVSGGRVVFS
jgi:hypothetical protein